MLAIEGVQRYCEGMFTRDAMIDQLEDGGTWDVIIIGGGATGLGAAVDAASRGYKTLLLEQSDFAKGTSSRSTKLVHGGVRYLQQGNISLVLEALHERGIMRQNAPHLVHDLAFIVPNYDWWEAPFYGIGLRVYDMLAGKYGFGNSRNLDKEETLARIPTIETDGLRGGVIYFDGQFDDARLALALAQTAASHGAVTLNYMRVTGLAKEDDLVRRVRACDEESGKEYELSAKVVINATGVFTDDIRRMDESEASPMIQPSQGVHLVLPRSFLPGDSAIMVPHTDDGRVLFAIPWHDRAVVGTTDTPLDAPSLEPRPQEEEIEFLMKHTARYLTTDPTESDVLSIFAGLRPLVRAGDDENTAALSRDHTIAISRSGLVTVTGGKWTTYRRMAQDTIDQAAVVGGLDERPCITENLRIAGYQEECVTEGPYAYYGTDEARVRALIAEDATLGQPLHPGLGALRASIVWAARAEMARTLEDALSRRTRSLLFGARASVEVAEDAAALMARELGKDEAWQHEQVQTYTDLAQGYILQ